MINRIETITDLITWLNCVKTLHKKNVQVEKLTDDQINILAKAQIVLQGLASNFQDPFKQCIKCGRIYPATKKWFDWNGRGRDGLNTICKFCRNAYQKKYKKTKTLGQHQYGSQSDLEEINSHREQGGLPPLSG